MKKAWLFVLVLFLLPSMVLAEHVIKKNLGDINGDGKPEVAIEKETAGSSVYTYLTIKSGNRTVLGGDKEIVLAGDTVDGYKVVGDRIVIWQGDWESEQFKNKPHYYDFTWYGWSKKTQKYVVVQEGFSRKSYSWQQAKKLMPALVKNPVSDKVVLAAPSFGQQAMKLASQKYGRKAIKVETANGGAPGEAKYCWVQTSQRRRDTVEVIFHRDGQIYVGLEGP